MSFLKRAAVAATAAVIVSAGLFAGPADAAAAKPAVVVDYGSAKVVTKVKPKTIRPYKDVSYTSVHWTKLTGSTGYATAVRKVNTCVPDCATGKVKSDKVSLKFTRVRKASNHRNVFTRVRVTVIKTHKVTTHALPTSVS
ncbi:hypothetical protein GCM10010435_95780 [Winogradskya consettensis]|uniref:Uncharacterized protein n=1 Tax=Winogradskya consettensis TaxID=113560 RepID=A0A919W4X5_9ACTN|nr:hypothetical protein [Actinoplanes consettensis]GIM79888.1 hypothetical protein Aco04nite_67830 [Actinoplanes consettensis]